MKLSLILPVLDHEDQLEAILADIRTQLHSVDPEVIVVYDVTRPDLLASVKTEQAALQARYAILPITRVDQRGFGSALRAGLAAAGGDVAIPIMADRSDDLGTIPFMLERIATGADVVAGSRYSAGGGTIGRTTKQRLSRLYSWATATLTSIPCHDVSNSFKAYRREVWENVPSEALSFDISVEMTVKAAALGFRVAEVPTVWTNRQTGRSNFRMAREANRYGRWLLYAAHNVPGPGLALRLFGRMAGLLLPAWGPARPLAESQYAQRNLSGDPDAGEMVRRSL